MPFQEYSPKQAALLPLHVRGVRREDHLVFLISAMVEKQDSRAWEAASSEDGLVVAARVTQAASDQVILAPLVGPLEPRCGRRPPRLLADAGFYSNGNLEELERRGVEFYVPDAVLAREMKDGKSVTGAARRTVACGLKTCAAHPGRGLGSDCGGW